MKVGADDRLQMAGVLAVVGACAVAVLASAGPGRERVERLPLPTQDASAAVAEKRLGGCVDPGLDSRGAETILGLVDRWIEVTDVPARSSELGQGRPTVPVAVTGRDVAQPESKPSDMLVRIEPHNVEGLDWAVDSDARAFLAMDSTEGPEHVVYVLVRHRDGSHFFVGYCAKPMLADPMRKALGSRYDAVMAEIVGKPGKQVAKLVGGKN